MYKYSFIHLYEQKIIGEFTPYFADYLKEVRWR